MQVGLGLVDQGEGPLGDAVGRWVIASRTILWPEVRFANSACAPLPATAAEVPTRSSPQPTNAASTVRRVLLRRRSIPASLDRKAGCIVLHDLAKLPPGSSRVEALGDNRRLQQFKLCPHGQMESPFLPEQQTLLGADKDCGDSCEDCSGLVLMHGSKQASGGRG